MSCHDCVWHRAFPEPGPKPPQMKREPVILPAPRRWWQFWKPEPYPPFNPFNTFALMHWAHWRAADDKHQNWVKCHRFPEVVEHPTVKPCGEFQPAPEAP